MKSKAKPKAKAKTKAKKSPASRSRGRPPKSAEQRAEEQKTPLDALDTKQTRFVHALFDPQHGRTIEQAAEHAGYTAKYGYKLHKKPAIQDALTFIGQRELEAISWMRSKVLSALAARAMQERVVKDVVTGKVLGISAADANRASEIFLKGIGQYSDGATIENHLHAESRRGSSSSESISDTIRGISSDRTRALGLTDESE